MEKKLLVDTNVLLQRFPGKGGWTYAALPSITANTSQPFRWIKVCGFIDDHEIKHYHLMPMGNGILFLPVKAEIRKKIRKQAGDTVHIQLFLDDSPLQIPADLLTCLHDEPAALAFFNGLSDSKKKAFIDHIEAAKSEKMRVTRLAAAVNDLAAGRLFSDTGNPRSRQQ